MELWLLAWPPYDPSSMEPGQVWSFGGCQCRPQMPSTVLEEGTRVWRLHMVWRFRHKSGPFVAGLVLLAGLLLVWPQSLAHIRLTCKRHSLALMPCGCLYACCAFVAPPTTIARLGCISFPGSLLMYISLQCLQCGLGPQWDLISAPSERRQKACKNTCFRPQSSQKTHKNKRLSKGFH